MDFISTRNASLKVSGCTAIVKGISDDGGLFVPSSFPIITKEEWQKLLASDYAERSAFVMSKYLTEFTYDELLSITQKAYSRFSGDPAPLVKTADGEFVLELWHGPTSAFKDMALTVLPYLLTYSKKKIGVSGKTLILVATSGDTGKAALEGFSDVDGTEIVVFYPDKGVSKMQETQMRTSKGKNVHVSGLVGNFDDAQSAVKEIFTNPEKKSVLKERGYDLSSANSINFGRLVPQVAYYISAYCDLVNAGEIEFGQKINYCVPCGNFGNILACHYAKQMGLPAGKMICASNTNNILCDFITTGVYDIRREFHKTVSPSMDILISSNLERLLFELTGRDDKRLSSMMSALKSDGVYQISKEELDSLQKDYLCDWATEEETHQTICDYFDETGYTLDPHTAVAVCVNNKLDSDTLTVIVSTASAYKFPTVVYKALTDKDISDAFKCCDLLEEYTAEPQPDGLKTLKTAPLLHDTVCEKKDIFDTVLKLIG
ncbi:MAG: threonine synthase [Clostridia bacterium]|nr:threonine synthase [Clostridia bacterium]